MPPANIAGWSKSFEQLCSCHNLVLSSTKHCPDISLLLRPWQQVNFSERQIGTTAVLLLSLLATSGFQTPQLSPPPLFPLTALQHQYLTMIVCSCYKQLISAANHIQIYLFNKLLHYCKPQDWPWLYLSYEIEHIVKQWWLLSRLSLDQHTLCKRFQASLPFRCIRQTTKISCKTTKLMSLMNENLLPVPTRIHSSSSQTLDHSC